MPADHKITVLTFHVPRLTSSQRSWTKQRCTRGVFNFKAVVIAKLTYARPAPPGGASPRPTTGRKWSLSSAVRLLHHQPGSSSRSPNSSRKPMKPYSRIFFTLNSIVLHQLLPNRTQSTYNLRSRKHDCSLSLL